MEKFKLHNGATIVIAECLSKELSVSVTVNVGHVNEPKLGIAALYENVLMKQVSRVQTVYGGTVTSFFTGSVQLLIYRRNVTRSAAPSLPPVISNAPTISEITVISVEKAPIPEL